MTLSITRRSALAGAFATLPIVRIQAATRPGKADVVAATKAVEALESRNGGRLGVMVLGTGTDAAIEYRADELFPITSTFKFLAAAGVLKAVDDGKARLDDRIVYAASDVEPGYSPVTKEHSGEGMTLEDVCAAAVVWSDNTAGNLLLRVLGGPQGLTRFARTLGDDVTRLDRTEPTLNTAIPGDKRDTTSPRALLGDARRILLGDALSPASRKRIEAWLIEDKVGGARIRAGLPAAWGIGDKTGSGDNGTTNTVALLWPPNGAPILAAVYYTGSTAPRASREAVHADVARIIVETFAG
ncbi:class A beta-lactamase [Mesorhizobium sp. WSM3864]|uniref:class A beta-lactamase n=1 Tax=Mesorhizobium sp. WSM3864 TaxID=2029404 RepID=UPI000BB024A0|nr:class A beta-lactamase [Mesorhizobium sp. WSM3864]PBB89463.1 class A beta-lactamase [Mesorhizobium sp. WSM3864]